MSSFVFVSHSAKNATTAQAVVAALEQAGIRCWVAPRDIQVGQAWADAILQAINSCGVMVVIVSEQANVSEHIPREVERAVNRKVPLVPLRIQNVAPCGSLEYFLSFCHWLDAYEGPLERHLDEVIQSVRQLLDGTPAKSISPVASAPPRKLAAKWLGAAGVGLVVVAAICGWVWNSLRHRAPALNPGPAPVVYSLTISPPSASTGRRTVTNSLGMRLVEIAPGSYEMGSPAGEAGHSDDERLHQVTLTKSFWIGATDVTVAQFARFGKDTGYQTDADQEGWAWAWKGNGTFEKVNGASWREPGFEQGDDHPVVEISWNDAVAFCAWLSRREGHHYRLPTEAEWEYCCRAGGSTAYPWGNDPDDGLGWANAGDLTMKKAYPDWTTFNWNDGYEFTSPVGRFKPNAWGLYDMVGNAWQWCQDGYGDYPDSAQTDPQGRPTAPTRVLRGGSWSGAPRDCRCAYRIGYEPNRRSAGFGFRIVLDYSVAG